MSDNLALIAAVILDYGITCEYHEPDPQCSQCQDMAANLASGIALTLDAEQPGRWVPWCVAHRSTQDGEHTWEAVCPEGWDADDCRWHPQGAFIPEAPE